MGLLKEMQKMSVNLANNKEVIMKHIASGKQYLVHEVIHSDPENLEYLINLFFENGYSLKSVSKMGLDTSSMNRSTTTLIFEKI